MALATGLEPASSRLKAWHSTLNYANENGASCRYRTHLSDLQDQCITLNAYEAKIGTLDRTRTRILAFVALCSSIELQGLKEYRRA